MRILRLIMASVFMAAACGLLVHEILPSVRASVAPDDVIGSAMAVEAIAPRFQDAVDDAAERLRRFDAETRLYRDPDAEVVIPGFGYGSPRAVRAQLQAQLEAFQQDLAQELSRPGRAPATGTAQLRVPFHAR
jgi:hypothetical protein